MSEFLLEIYSEEIPSSAQALAQSELKNSFTIFLKNERINFSLIETFATPRRITLIISGLKNNEKELTKEVRGPSTAADKKAIMGFLKSQGVENQKHLLKKEIKGKEYFFLKKIIKQKSLLEIFQSEVFSILSSIKWKKSMRWASFNEKWSRPIKSILCVLDKKIVSFDYAGVKSNYFTFGNYHYFQNKIKCLDSNSYKKNLKKHFVVLDKKERIKKIENELEKFSKKNELIVNYDQELMSRVSDSVEWPNVFFGSFEESFFDLPDFLLITIISEKQDNFSFKKKNGKLSNFFSFVSNLETNKKTNLIVGNQNVLKARFKDATFFVEEDNKIKFSERIKKLSTIVFYNNLGTLLDRSERIQKLCVKISEILKLDISSNINNLKFSNIDLTTELVREYPSLQGKVGGFYSELSGFNEEICNAFSKQYEFSDNIVENDLTFILSLSQKIDSVFGFFALDRKVSGSGDPFGVRRMVLSIINLLLFKNASLSFSSISEILKQIYENQNIKIIFNKNKMIEFLNKRFEVLLLERGYEINIVKSCLQKDEFDPSYSFMKIKSFKDFLISKEGIEFLKSYKRLESIISEKEINIKIEKKLFQKIEEERLYVDAMSLKEDYKKNSEILNKKSFYDLSKSINNFLDNVMVNTPEEKIKYNRISLLNDCKKIINNFFNFSKL